MEKDYKKMEKKKGNSMNGYISTKKKPMTVEEMEKRWDNVAPPCARYILFCNNSGHFQRIEITQDELQNIRDYLDAVEECLNG